MEELTNNKLNVVHSQLEVFTKIGIIIFGVLYSSGVIVYTIYLSSYGINDFNLLKIKYIIIGAIVNLIPIITIGFYYYMLDLAWDNQERYALNWVLRKLNRLSYYAPIIVLIVFIIYNFDTIVAFPLVISILIMLFSMNFSSAEQDNSSSAKSLAKSTDYFIFVIFLIGYLSYLSVYSLHMFSSVGSIYKSIAGVEVQLIFKEDLNINSIPLVFDSNYANRTIPFTLIYENELSYYLVVDDESRKVISIRKDIVNSMLINNVIDENKLIEVFKNK